MWLGLDIGTSAVKAVLVADDGKVAAEASAPLAISRPRPRWSEQAPEDWWTATNQAVHALPQDLRGQAAGIGLSGQMHGAVLLDRNDRPLRPAILWNDGRAAAECVALEQAEPRSRTITGNAAMPGFTAPKLLWMRAHEPETFAATAKVLLPKDYVRLRMTGEHATDLSDASGTLWLDVANRCWSPEMIAASGLDQRQLPRLHEGCEITGRLRPAVACAWGVPGVPVVAGGGDNAAGAVGCGVVAEGEAFLSLGTSGVLFAATDRFRPASDRGAHAFCHALPATWHQMAVMLSAASAVDWAARTLGFADTASALLAAESGEPFAGGEVFLPYLSGERTPHNDPFATGAFAGLTHETDAPALMRAVLEGVAFGLADGLDVLSDAGSRLGAIRVIGGGARSRFWGGVLAAALDRPLAYSSDGHLGPAFGAARLACMGLTGRPAREVCPPPAVDRIVEPDPALRDAAARKRPRFRSLYAHLKERDA